MSMQPLTKDQYERLKSGDVDGFVFPKDHSTDGQFLDDIGRRMNFASESGPTYVKQGTFSGGKNAARSSG